MAGLIIPILDKRVFEFSFLGASPAAQDVVLHPAVDITAFYRVKLLVRVHSITATTGNFQFRFYNTFPSEQDPQEFTDSTAVGTAASITTASPNIVVANTTTDAQAFLKIVLRASQGTAGNTLYGEFSAALLCRET